jgi:predicted MFS family arabinose efflux permease
MERNLRRYPLYAGLWHLLFWMPVFFLYLSTRVPPHQVLLLEAIYYAGVVVLEVPSGYLSDRIGRRRTLLLGSVAWVLASCGFVLGTDLLVLGLAQLLLATGMACTSGTDTSLLYETLQALGREEEIIHHEARAQAVGFRTGALAAVIGGLAGSLDLRLAYVLSALAAAGACAVLWGFQEPPRQERASSPLAQVRRGVAQLRTSGIRWLVLVAVGLTICNHIPYELMQPWLDLLLAAGEEGGSQLTPAVAGLLIALVGLAGAAASRAAPALQARLGLVGVLVATVALQGCIITGMGLALHPAVLLLILLRAVPRGLAQPVLRAALHPHLSGGLRATFLSLVSLAGRLGFSLTLVVLSLGIGAPSALTWPLLSGLLQVLGLGTLAGGLGLLVLAMARRPELD